MVYVCGICTCLFADVDICVCAGQRIVSSVLLYHSASYSSKIVSLEQDRQVATPNAPPVSSSPKC